MEHAFQFCFAWNFVCLYLSPTRLTPEPLIKPHDGTLDFQGFDSVSYPTPTNLNGTPVDVVVSFVWLISTSTHFLLVCWVIYRSFQSYHNISLSTLHLAWWRHTYVLTCLLEHVDVFASSYWHACLCMSTCLLLRVGRCACLSTCSLLSVDVPALQASTCLFMCVDVLAYSLGTWWGVSTRYLLVGLWHYAPGTCTKCAMLLPP